MKTFEKNTCGICGCKIKTGDYCKLCVPPGKLETKSADDEALRKILDMLGIKN